MVWLDGNGTERIRHGGVSCVRCVRLAFLLEEGQGEEGGGDNPAGRGEGGEVPLSKVVCSIH